MHQQQERINNLEDALRLAHAENAKKSAELHAMDLLRARLENDLQHVREELDRQSRSRWRLSRLGCFHPIKAMNQLLSKMLGDFFHSLKPHLTSPLTVGSAAV